MTLSLQGDYFELLDFLFRLDDMERIVVVQNISITAAVGHSIAYEDITLSLFRGIQGTDHGAELWEPGPELLPPDPPASR